MQHLPFPRQKYIFHSHKFLSGFSVWEKNKDSVGKKERNKMDYMIGTHTGERGAGGGVVGDEQGQRGELM